MSTHNLYPQKSAILHIPGVPDPLQNHFMQPTEPRRHSPDHPWSQDSPFPDHDGYQVIFGQVFWSTSK